MMGGTPNPAGCALAVFLALIASLSGCDDANASPQPPPAQGSVAACLPTADPSPADGERASLHDRLHIPPTRPGALQMLTSCHVFELTETAPNYLGRVAEGNVAPWGIVLSATRSPKLAKQLIEQRRQGEWEYSRGYGVTAADTAMVLEGLLAAGVGSSVVRDSLQRLEQKYLDRATGGFATVEGGRAQYWRGVSIETTAHIAYLMQRVDAEGFGAVIAKACDFVVSRQRADGGWSGRWFPSQIMPTFQAMRFLSSLGGHRRELDRAARFLRSLVRSDGSVAGSVIETSLAVLALRRAARAPRLVQRARRWLRANTKTCSRSEPVLYYWMESGTRRWFFSCEDRGGIAQAWAARALAD